MYLMTSSLLSDMTVVLWVRLWLIGRSLIRFRLDDNRFRWLFIRNSRKELYQMAILGAYHHAERIFQAMLNHSRFLIDGVDFLDKNLWLLRERGCV